MQPNSAYAKAMLDQQANIIESLLSKDSERSLQQRREINKALSDSVIQIVASISPGIVLEIGANEAAFSLRIKSLRPKARVIAFEANSAIFSKFSKRPLEADIEYLPLCVGAEQGKQDFVVPVYNKKASRSMGSLRVDMKAEDLIRQEVEVVTLDGFLGDDLGQANAMWVDVEGAVDDVIKGARRSLDHCRVFYCEIEAKARWQDQALDVQIIEMLNQYGLVPVIRDVQRKGWQYNCLFVQSVDINNAAVTSIIKSYWEQVAKSCI